MSPSKQAQYQTGFHHLMPIYGRTQGTVKDRGREIGGEKRREMEERWRGKDSKGDRRRVRGREEESERERGRGREGERERVKVRGREGERKKKSYLTRRRNMFESLWIS